MAPRNRSSRDFFNNIPTECGRSTSGAGTAVVCSEADPATSTRDQLSRVGSRRRGGTGDRQFCARFRRFIESLRAAKAEMKWNPPHRVARLPLHSGDPCWTDLWYARCDAGTSIELWAVMILLSSSDRPRPSKAYALVKFFKRTSTTLSISSTVVYSCAGWPTFSPRGRRRRALGLVTSVNVV